MISNIYTTRANRRHLFLMSHILSSKQTESFGRAAVMMTFDRCTYIAAFDHNLGHGFCASFYAYTRIDLSLTTTDCWGSMLPLFFFLRYCVSLCTMAVDCGCKLGGRPYQRDARWHWHLKTRCWWLCEGDANMLTSKWTHHIPVITRSTNGDSIKPIGNMDRAFDVCLWYGNLVVTLPVENIEFLRAFVCTYYSYKVIMILD